LQHLLAAFPYLLRHHIRPRCTGTNIAELQKSGNGLLLREEPFYPVETRYEGDKEARENASSKPKVNCWVDKRSLPWSLLPNYILDRIATSINRPLWVCDHMATEVASLSFTGKWTNRERLQYFDKVEKLTNAIGECERIHHTAVPLNYARHSLRSLTLWLFTLPFALIKDLGFLTGPAMGIVAWLLFGVYEIGYSIKTRFWVPFDCLFFVTTFEETFLELVEKTFPTRHIHCRFMMTRMLCPIGRRFMMRLK
jgi:hypothetical protein